MQKRIFLSAALGLAMFANTAFAEVNTDYLANELRSYPGWPLEVYCNATDVNVRTQPNTDCDVITMLQRGDKFYVSMVVDVVNSEYKWLLCTSQQILDTNHKKIYNKKLSVSQISVRNATCDIELASDSLTNKLDAVH